MSGGALTDWPWPHGWPAAAQFLLLLLIADGLKYVAETAEKFDAIIVDSSEPIGPSAVLHTRAFFMDCKRALKPGGVLITQNGLPFLAVRAISDQADEALPAVMAGFVPAIYGFGCLSWLLKQARRGCPAQGRA